MTASSRLSFYLNDQYFHYQRSEVHSRSSNYQPYFFFNTKIIFCKRMSLKSLFEELKTKHLFINSFLKDLFINSFLGQKTC